MTARKVALFLFSLCPGLAVAQPLPPDLAVVTGSVEAVCTGASLDAREDPRWPAYSLKLEFAGEGGRYLGGETVTVRKQGKEVFSGSCEGPWLLLRLPAGRYAVEARLNGNIVSSSAVVPAAGQARVVLRFAETPTQP